MSQTTTPKKVDQVLTEYREAGKTAATNMEEVPVKMRPGRAMAKNQATEALPGLYKAVTDATVPVRLVGIFAGGDAKAVAGVSKFLTENRGVVVDAGAFYQDLGVYAEAALGGDRHRAFNTVCFTRMMSALREIADKHGVKLSRLPEYEEAICPDTAAFVSHVRKQVRDAYGDELAIKVVTAAIVDAVVKGNLSDKRIPVLVVGATEDEQPALAQLFTRARAVEFAPDFEITEESVVSTFKGR